ncbi:MAG: ABC transporter ATP-binding protein [Solobacterium sp.]|nr:ABC transporter ATP-binding protein [Solobacterium sp.]
MSELFLNIVDIYHYASIALFTIGLWKVLEKCGAKGWWALLPGGRYFKLGDVVECDNAGIVVLFLEICYCLLWIAGEFVPHESMSTGIIGLAVIVVVLIQFAFMFRIYTGVCFTFGKSWRWMFLWVPFNWIAALIFGFNPKFQPVNLGIRLNEDLKAGTDPATIGTIRNYMSHIQDGGLTVMLKERTVRDFNKKRYLLKDIYFTIPNNSLVLLLGGSGSGKTTLVNAITGYEKANAEIYLNGQNVYEQYELMKYKIGFVPQQDLLRYNDTVLNTLNDAAKLRLPTSMKRKDRTDAIDEVLDTLGLVSGKSGLVSKKSGGMKKRISIGTELICRPELFILDEPDSGLDGVIARELFETLQKIAHTGRIVIAITHTPDRVVNMFDKVIVLARDSGRVGRLAFYGRPDEALKFFGKDSMENIIMAINRKDEGGEGRADEFIAKYAEYVNEHSGNEEKEELPDEQR